MQSKLQVTAKTGDKGYVASASGKSFRVQVKYAGFEEVRPGLMAPVNKTGFVRFIGGKNATAEQMKVAEDACVAFVAAAKANGMTLPGKVIFIDQLSPIYGENGDYGKLYPYPASHNGVALDIDQRLLVQQKAAEAGICLMQSGKTIFRNKLYTTDMSAKDSILSPDNQEDIENFTDAVLGAVAPDNPKVMRLAELRAIAKAKRTDDQKKELESLIVEIEG